MAIFFTADTHFGDQKICSFFKRPFDTVAQMDECILDNWAKTVQPSDIVYHLGDVCLASRDYALSIAQKLKTLPGQKFLVPGNHDHSILKYIALGFNKILDLYVDEKFLVNNKKIHCVLCHYPFTSWNLSVAGSKQFYGHVHGKLQDSSNQIDVGVDRWNFNLVEISTLIAAMEKLPQVKMTI